MTMALRKLIAGNWKMNGNRDVLAELDLIATAAVNRVTLDVAVCPPFTLIADAVTRAPALMIGAQDCHFERNGAHTGCISAAMLREAGARLVIVGHSERRADQHETDAEVRAKAEAVISAGMIALVCVGETEAQRDAGRALGVVQHQLAGSVPANGTPEQLVIAYEPVWAIGTGRIPSEDDVAGMHASIRTSLLVLLGQSGATIRILYGGSVKPANARDLLHIANVDGALVGGASLAAADFVPIIDGAVD
jgi:triosephosphate isomerase